MKASDKEIAAFLASNPGATVRGFVLPSAETRPQAEVSRAREIDQGMSDPTAGKNKYRAVKREYKGIVYDSIGEAKHAEQLDLRQMAGEILWYVRQVPFTLGVPENRIRVDFLVVAPHGVWVEEFKGVATAKWRRDMKLWESYGPCVMRVYHRKANFDITPKHLRTN